MVQSMLVGAIASGIGAGSTALDNAGTGEMSDSLEVNSLCAAPTAISMNAAAGTIAWRWTYMLRSASQQYSDPGFLLHQWQFHTAK